MAVPEPQSAILPEPGENALFLVLRLRDRSRDAKAAVRAAARIPAETAKLAKAWPKAKLVSAVALGPELWDAVSPARRPAGFGPFEDVAGAGGRAPATGGDLLLHTVSRQADVGFELAHRLRDVLGDTATVLEEVHGFKYLDARDLTGFIDGTENPSGRKARAGAALLGSDDPFAGGSFVFTQRYVHDLAKWEGLGVRDQEKIIGRRKKDSAELSDRAKPPTAHIARVVIHEDGEELEIVRHSFPYGTTSESGLFFIAYTNDLATPTKMLRRMLGASGDGHHDHLMGYTRAVSGAHFFAPSQRTLRSLVR